MSGGFLPKTENKRICQTSCLKTGRGPCIKNLLVTMRELLEQYLTEKQNGYLQSGRLWEVVAYEKWSL